MIGSTFLELLPTAHLHLRRDLSLETSKNTYPVWWSQNPKFAPCWQLGAEPWHTERTTRTANSCSPKKMCFRNGSFMLIPPTSPCHPMSFMQQDKNIVHYMASKRSPGEKHFKTLKNNQRTSWKPKKNLYETLGNHMKPLGCSKRLSGLEDAVSYEYSSSSPVGVPKVEPSSGWCSYSMRKQSMSKKNLEINNS